MKHQQSFKFDKINLKKTIKQNNNSHLKTDENRKIG